MADSQSDGGTDMKLPHPSPLTCLAAEARNSTIEAAIDFTGGVAGGVASVYIGQPLDTVKVKMQTFPTYYKNAWHCFQTTLKSEGVPHGLYAGTLPSLAAQVSENAILFMAYGLCQKAVAALRRKDSAVKLNPVENAVAGGLAAFWSSIVLCPTELIKCRLQALPQLKESGELNKSVCRQMSRGNVIGPCAMTKQILQTEGVRGLFSGFVPTLYREMPGYFFFFGGYEVAKLLVSKSFGLTNGMSPLGTIFCGAVGGVSLWIAVFPADVLKSRAQVHFSTSSTKMGFFSTLAHIQRTEGVPALYKGLGPCLLRTIPATGGLFLAYETTSSYLRRTLYCLPT